MKKAKGFTLIELIVVIAIIGVLAAILVPSLMGWVRKSKISSDNSSASELCGQLQPTIADLENDGHTVPDMQVIYDGSTFTFTETVDTEIKNKFLIANNCLTDITKSQWAIEIKDKQILAVAYSVDGCRFVGGFPTQCPVKQEYSMPGGNIQDYLKYADADITDDWEDIKAS